MTLFPTEAPLEEVALDILGESVRTTRGNRYLLEIVDRYSKLFRTVPLKKIRPWDIVEEFVTHWVFTYGPPPKVLTDNGSQFIAKFTQEVCRIIDSKFGRR